LALNVALDFEFHAPLVSGVAVSGCSSLATSSDPAGNKHAGGQMPGRVGNVGAQPDGIEAQDSRCDIGKSPTMIASARNWSRPR